MKAQILDRDALKAISPSAMSAYARGEGWAAVERYGDVSDVFVRDGVSELIIPGTDTVGDYAAVVSSIIRTIANIESRDELQVYRDLVGAERDVIRVRAPDAEDDGSVRVETGVEIVSHARDMLLSAACAATEPRASYRAGKVKEAAGYMNKVRLGQTEHGSFVVTLLAPVPPTLAAGIQQTLWPVEATEPYERLVTRRLADALVAARGAADNAVRGGGLESFKQAIPRGVSANLCEALAVLIDRGAGLDVSITWAKTRPTPESRRSVTFTPTYSEVFSEAARLFRSQEPRPDEQLEAFVVKLDRDKPSPLGKITLKAFLDGLPVSVKTELPEHLYQIATDAHANRQAISIVGDLVRQGQRWRMDNPRDLVTLADEGLDEA